MTKKETLLKKLKELQYDIALEKGEVQNQIEEVNLEWESRHYRACDLQQEIEAAKKRLEKIRASKRIEEYYGTPEGSAYKATLEQQKESEESILKNARERYASKIECICSSYLKDGWVVDAMDITNIEIKLTDVVDGEDVFGHDFGIRMNERYNYKDDCTEYKIEANIGTMGSFDVLHDFKRVQLYATFASMVSDRELMSKLLDLMIEYSSFKKECWKAISEINSQLENPQI